MSPHTDIFFVLRLILKKYCRIEPDGIELGNWGANKK